MYFSSFSFFLQFIYLFFFSSFIAWTTKRVGSCCFLLPSRPLLILRWRIDHEGFSLCWTRGRVSTQLECSPTSPSPLLLLCIYLSISCICMLLCMWKALRETDPDRWFWMCVCVCGSFFFRFCYLLFRLTFLSVRRTSCFFLFFHLSLPLPHYVYQQGRKAVLQQPQQQQRRLSSGRSAPKCWESDRTRSASASWRSWNNK